MESVSCRIFPKPPSSAARPDRSAPPRGNALTCANWQIEAEAAYRMIQNNLDPEVAENPDELVVYGGIGKAARNWPAFDAILDSLRQLKADETLLVQSGKPVGVFRTHAGAPRRVYRPAHRCAMPCRRCWTPAPPRPRLSTRAAMSSAA